MKKLVSVLTIAAIALSFSFAANAYDGGKFFHMGVKGGLNFSNIGKFDVDALKKIDFNSYTGFNVGLAFQLNLPMGFTLQPEIIYQQNGSKIKDFDATLKQGNLLVPVNVQWGIRLGKNFRPYVMASPYFGTTLNKSLDYAHGEKTTFDKNDFVFGAGLGIGVDIWRFQVSFKYNWDFTESVYKADKAADMLHASGKYSGAELSVAFFLF